MSKVKNYLNDYKLVLRNIPSLTVVFFVVAVLLMNLLGNRELYNSQYLCLNNGIIFSWVSFACMDCVCKRFGKSAAIKLNVVATIIEILIVTVFYVIMKVPGGWAASFSAPDAATGTLINDSLNSTFAGTWYIVFWSAVAMLASGAINAILNVRIGEKVDDGSYKGFSLRSFISTIVAQFIDNMIFATAVSHVLFGWNWTQVIVCSITSMIIEFLLEAAVSPLTYKITKSWERDNVGSEYLKRM